MADPRLSPPRMHMVVCRIFLPCMSLLLAFTSLSTSTMASVANCPLPAALAALSDTPCLQSVPTTSLQTSSSSGNGAEHEHDDQQEQRQHAHRHHPGSDNGDIAVNNVNIAVSEYLSYRPLDKSTRVSVGFKTSKTKPNKITGRKRIIGAHRACEQTSVFQLLGEIKNVNINTL